MPDWTVKYDIEPIGSPAYVRRLRDQAAVHLMQVHVEVSGADALSIRETNGPRVEKEDVLAHFAVRDGDALVRALGYERPGGTPGKEG